MSMWMSMYGDVEWEAKTLGSCKELTLFCNEMDDGYMWDIVNRSRLMATVEADFSGSENIKVLIDGKEVDTFKVTTEIWPLQRKRVGHVLVKDVKKEFAVQCRWKQTLSECPVEVLQQIVKNQDGEVTEMLQTARTHFSRVCPDAHSFQSLQALCENAQNQFVDFRFPPTMMSISSDPLLTKKLARPLQWRRPEEFLSSLAPALPDLGFPVNNETSGRSSTLSSGIMTAMTQKDQFASRLWEAANERPLIEVFSDYNWQEILPTDVQRGGLSDSWLLTGLAIASDIPILIKNVFEEADDDCLEGFYALNLYKLGHRIRVTIDDYIPCYPNGGPVFSRGSMEDLWVSLVEKAFAKVHGDYASLRGGGYLDEALIDITGLPVTRINIQKTFFKNVSPSPRDVNSVGGGVDALWKKLKKAEMSDAIVTCVTKGETLYGEVDYGEVDLKTGLVPGHGYCVVRTAETPSGIRMVRMFAPWGEAVWKGRYGSIEDWTKEDRLAVGGMFEERGEEEENDGRFWICVEDVARHFENLVICWTTDFASAANSNSNNQIVVQNNEQNNAPMPMSVSQNGKGVWRFHNVMKRTGKDTPAKIVWHYDVILEALKTTIFISADQFAPRMRAHGFSYVHPRVPLCISLVLMDPETNRPASIITEDVSQIEQRGLCVEASIKPGKYKAVIWTPVAKFHSSLTNLNQNQFSSLTSLTYKLPEGTEKLLPAVRLAVEGVFLVHAHCLPSFGLVQEEFELLMGKGGEITKYFSGADGWKRAVAEYGCSKNVGGGMKKEIVTLDGFIAIFEVIAALKSDVALVLLGAWGVDETLAERMRRALGVTFHSFAPIIVEEVPSSNDVLSVENFVRENTSIKIDTRFGNW
eukprot:GDKJ01012077.1.p1 GENE.GDKJ01012077.1~~GDKJ01012077.1.p1  ORF type:complete len:919 (-),score=188.88 GDKJ01012077.1:77-2674(-)